MSKRSTIKISFEIGGEDNPQTSLWNRDDFRLFIKSLQEDTQTPFVFYIITEETDTDFVEHVATIFDIESENIIYVNSTEEKFEEIEENGIDVHFDGDQEDVNYINSHSEPAVSSSTYPRNNGLLVNYLRNNSTLTMKYIEKFRAILATLI